MPYLLHDICKTKGDDEKVNDNKKCWFVENAETNKRYSKNPLTKEKARKQRVAIILGESKKTGAKPNTFFV